MTIKTFKRYEIKYLITAEQFHSLCKELEKIVVPDPFCANEGSYMIYNLYFDTDTNAVIRHSLDKPFYKEKLRMRSYTMPTSGEDTVFLELKKKIGGIVAKRRAIMTFSQALNFIENGVVPAVDTYQDRQVLSEIAGFLARYPAKPKVFISYQRTAFFDKDDPDLRISFDRDILTRRENVDLTSGDYGAELLTDGRILMEVKCGGHIPLWLCRMLSERNIHKTNFSKYGLEYKNHICGVKKSA